MGAENRRDRRFQYRIAATLVRGREEKLLLTEDVSFRGLFLRTDSPPALRQLVRIVVKVPPEDYVLRAHAMVVHVVEARVSDARVPGAGVQFYGLDGPARKHWERFVLHVQETSAAAEAPPSLARPPVEDPVRRRFPRFPAELTLRLATVDALHTLVTRDLSKSGMFICSDLQLPVGTSVVVHVVHPESKETFSIECVVRRIQSGSSAGIGVEFINLTDARRDEFFEFVRADIPVTFDEDVVYVEMGDPELA